MANGCKAKHTEYQPTEAEWRCPECGAGSAVFVVFAPADGADEDCCRLHVLDVCRCFHCGKTWSGRSLAQLGDKRAVKVPCPHCGGSGFIPGETREKGEKDA